MTDHRPLCRGDKHFLQFFSYVHNMYPVYLNISIQAGVLFVTMIKNVYIFLGSRLLWVRCDEVILTLFQNCRLLQLWWNMQLVHHLYFHHPIVRSDLISSPPTYNTKYGYLSWESYYNTSYYTRLLPPVPKDCPLPMGTKGEKVKPAQLHTGDFPEQEII